MATRLERIKLDEVSGVDEPANLVPGWLLMKSAPGRPVKLTDGRQVGHVVGVTTDGKATVSWVNDEMRELAKHARLEERDDAIYLVGDDAPLGIAQAALRHGSVVLT
jgi:hypothetical protein